MKLGLQGSPFVLVQLPLFGFSRQSLHGVPLLACTPAIEPVLSVLCLHLVCHLCGTPAGPASQADSVD